MRKNDEKFNKHCTKSALCAMFEARGITLTTLVVTIVVLLILAGVATYSGIEAIDNTKRTKFIAELKIMQSYVNQWYEDCKPSVNAENYDEKFASNVQTKFTINDKVAVNAASTEPINSEKVNTAKIALAAASVPSENYGNFYLLEDNEKSALGVEGVSQAVLVSVRDRKVVSYLGLKYKGNMYYTIDSLDSENGIDAIYNVGYENPNTNTPTLQITGRSIYNGKTAKGAKYKFTVDVKYKFPGDVIQDSDYINKGDLYYGKIENGEVKNWNKTEDKSFIVDRDGTYQFRYIDAAGNESVPIDYVIEPKAILISGENFNKRMKSLSGTSSPAHTTANTNITTIKISDTKPSKQIIEDANHLVSISTSKYPVYMWFENGTIYLWSEENWIGFNPSAAYMFEKLQALSDLNLNNFDTQNVTSMYFTFESCKSLTNLDLSSFNTSKVQSMGYMFRGCSALKNLNVSGFDTASATSFSFMFNNCANLTDLDLSSFKPINVKGFENMFASCSGLTNLTISNFNTNSATTMGSMFYGCNHLTSLDVSHFNTQNVTSMSMMFYGCSGLTSLDLSNFNTNNVTSMALMFYGCRGLKSLNISNFDTKNVINMAAMFTYCSDLTSLDLSKWDVSKVTTFYNQGWNSGIFTGCSKLKTLDLSSWNTISTTEMRSMFSSCSLLETIYVSENFVTTSVTNSANMFSGCSKLIGGDGTKYNSRITDKTYARIDYIDTEHPENSKPGYFTRKSNV